MRFNRREGSHECGVDALAFKQHQSALSGANHVHRRALCNKGCPQVASTGRRGIEDENIFAGKLIHWVPQSAKRSLGAGYVPAVPIDNHPCATVTDILLAAQFHMTATRRRSPEESANVRELFVCGTGPTRRRAKCLVTPIYRWQLTGNGRHVLPRCAGDVRHGMFGESDRNR
jgi:hypothetical protein